MITTKKVGFDCFTQLIVSGNNNTIVGVLINRDAFRTGSECVIDLTKQLLLDNNGFKKRSVDKTIELLNELEVFIIDNYNDVDFIAVVVEKTTSSLKSKLIDTCGYNISKTINNKNVILLKKQIR